MLSNRTNVHKRFNADARLIGDEVFFQVTDGSCVMTPIPGVKIGNLIAID